jgi:protein-disulfide isomerase
VTVAALAVAVGIIVVNLKPAPSPGATLITPPLSYASSVVSGPSLGRPDAPVTLEVYVDFQCPICGRLVREQFGTLKTTFVDPGSLRIESRDIAILGFGSQNESSDLATGARCAAAQNRYWEFHDYVFWNQKRENQGDYSSDFIKSVASAAGVDVPTWESCVNDGSARGDVQAATQAAAAAGINATPTLVLNGGTPVPGLPAASALQAQIQALVDAAAASGTPAP